MKIHFVGIGGIGMSGLAQILLATGHQVSGSDIRENSFTHILSRNGATIYSGHRASQVAGCHVLVYSSAIDQRNPELQEAQRKGIPLIPRGMLAARIMNAKQNIAVAGTHGKTTTTSLIAELLLAANMDPTILMGGVPKRLNSNSRSGLGKWALIESDESDASFLELHPDVAVITNIEEDHLSFYGSLRNITAAFRSFLHNVRAGGYMIANTDDAIVQSITSDCKAQARLLSFGLHPGSKISAVDIELGPTSSSMDMLYGKRVLGRLTTPLVGMHNMYNTLAAIAVALSLGMGWGKIQSCLQQFRGVRRRLEQVGCIGPVPVFDDYAHHPTEIQATLKTLKSHKHRIIAIFQPHRYTRIQSLFSEFLMSFDNADVLIVTPIYGAGEKTDRSLTDAQLYAALKKSRQLPTFFAANHQQIVSIVQQNLTSTSLVVTLGAGDITDVPPILIGEARWTPE